MIDYGWHDLLGNIGVVMVIVTYFALQTGRMSVNDRVYSLLNAMGAVLILMSLMIDFNLSSFIIEIVWLSISIYGLMRRQPVGEMPPGGGQAQ